MLVLIKNEIIKLLLRKKTLVVTLAFAALIGIIIFGSYREAVNMRKYESTEYKISALERSIAYTEGRRNTVPSDIKDDASRVEEYKKNLDNEVESLKKQLTDLKSLSGKELDWREELKLNISNLEQQIKSEVQAPERMRNDWKLELNKLKYLQDNDIRPVKDYEVTAFNFISKLVMILGTIFMAIGIVVFVSDMVSGECTPPTLKLLLTQPVTRGKVLLSKFIAVTITASVLVLGIELLYFLVVGFIFGFGDANYPMMIGSRFQYDMTAALNDGSHPLALIAGSASIIPVWKYTILLLLWQLLFIIVCSSFAFLLSTVLKSSMVSMAVSIVSIIASLVMIEAVPALRKVASYLFTSYGDVTGVLDGKAAMAFNNPNINIPFILTVFVVWTILCYFVSHMIFTKKDMLI